MSIDVFKKELINLMKKYNVRIDYDTHYMLDSCFEEYIFLLRLDKLTLEELYEESE